MEGSDLSLIGSHKKNPDVIFSKEGGKKLQNHYELCSWVLAIILELFLLLPNCNSLIM